MQSIKQRSIIADLIFNKMQQQKTRLVNAYNATKSEIGYFYIDDLLPPEIAKSCFEFFPSKPEMKCLNSIRECKYVSAQMDRHHKQLEEILYAFQDKRIVKLVNEICNIDSLYADESLYAGGLSLMAKGNFLNPHLDNSHDAKRERWRVLNLLYYVTPDWKPEYGGHLELWPNGPKNEPIVVESKFNRLAIMATHESSWHSVNEVLVDKERCCISNYYFSDYPLKDTDTFHVTKYRGRPEETFKNLVLDVDAKIRMTIRKVFKKGVRKNSHMYKK